MKQYNFIMPSHRGSFVVVHLYSSFFCGPQDFLLWANLYQKIANFGDFWVCKSIFVKATTVKFSEKVPGTPHSKFGLKIA